MAYPWLVEETFDDGTRGNFDSTTDSSSILSFPNYKTLANQGLAPWRGAHAFKMALNGTAVGYIVETTGFDTSAAGTIHIWLSVCIPANLSLSSGDTIILFALQSAGPVNEAVFGVRNNSGAYELFAGETGATRTLAITRNNKKWYQIELSCLIDSGGNDGTIDFYVDGGAVGAQITGLTQAAITQGSLGAISGTGSGNTGTILIGGIMADDARIYPRERFPLNTFWVTRDMNCFVGQGVISKVELTGTSTDAVVSILDTDNYVSTGNHFSREPRVYVRNTTANADAPNAQIGPILFNNGAYVQLTGTNPQALVYMADEGSGYVKSSGGYIDRAFKRHNP